MAVFRLPLDAVAPNYRMSITLDDTPYIFDVRWNGRDGAWYFDLYDIVEAPILVGIKIVLGAVLGVRSKDVRFPTGALYAVDLSGDGRDATIDDLGTRVVVFYNDRAQVEADLAAVVGA